MDDDNATLPSTFAASQPLTPGRSAVDPRYDMGPVIGRGGMGEIRIARDTRIDREVAVKLMHGSAQDEESISRFFREARVQGALEHPAMVPVHDLGRDADGNPYFVMKKVTGTTLASVLDETSTKFPRRTLLARLVDVTNAIVFAHARGVIHRDLKPANIMLGDFGEAYVLDWGLARIVGDRESFRAVLPLSGEDNAHTAIGALLGTPGYMSPEQARGEEVDTATDVFALGTILYEILAGEAALPRGLSAIDATLAAREHRPSARGDTPPELDDLCAAATAQERKQRPTARVFGQRLQAYLDGDRDLERRRALAEDHAKRADAAFRASGDGARASAMREAGQAIAIDPENARAGALLGRLLLDAPETAPAEAIANADEERATTRARLIRTAGFGFFGIAAVVPMVFLLEVHYKWVVFAVMAFVAGFGGLSVWLSTQPLTLGSRWYLITLGLETVVMAAAGLLFGPLLIMPVLITGSVSVWLLVPSTYSAWWVVLFHAAAILPLFALEWIGVIPATYHLSGGGLTLTPWIVELTPAATAVILAVTITGQQINNLFIIVHARRAAEAAQNRIHTHRWHLAQMLPKSKD